MISKFKQILLNRSTKNLIINTIGNYLNVFFVAFFTFLLVRVLSVSEYGIFGVLFGIIYTLVGILDFGTTANIYGFLPELVEKKISEGYRYLKTLFIYQSFFSLITISVFVIFFNFFDQLIFKIRIDFLTSLIVGLSTLFFVWQNFLTNVYNSTKKFFKTNLYLNLSNVIKVVIILIFVYFKKINLFSIIFIFGVVGPLIYFFLVLLDKKKTIEPLIKAKIDLGHFRPKFTLVSYLGYQFLNLGQRLDLFILSYYFPRTELLGFYTASQKIILTVLTSIVSVTQVISPNFSLVKTRKEAKRELIRGFMYSLVPIGIFLLLFFTPSIIYLLFFTEKYLATVKITRSLVFPYILYTLAAVPSIFLLYTIKKPKYLFLNNLFFLLLSLILNIFFIEKYNVFGPALSYGISYSLCFIILIMISIKEYQRLK